MSLKQSQKVHLLAVALAALIACGGLVLSCSDSKSVSQVPEGNVLVVISDESLGLLRADSDLVTSFSMTFSRLALLNAAGQSFPLNVSPVAVELASTSGKGSIVCIATVPAGRYVGAAIEYDWDNASCYLPLATSAASICDQRGRPLQGHWTHDVRHESPGSMYVAPNVDNILAFQFYSRPALSIDSAANAVTVSPVLLIPNRGSFLWATVRGTLSGVASSTPQFFVRPTSGLALGPSARIEASVGQANRPLTTFVIDSAVLQGAVGLAALANVPTGTAIEVVGDGIALSDRNLGIWASLIRVGTAVSSDSATGYVTSRTDDVATQRATLILSGPRIQLQNSLPQIGSHISVEVGLTSASIVTDIPLASSLTTAILDVGSRITAIGSVVNGATLVADLIYLQESTVLGQGKQGMGASSTSVLNGVRLGAFPLSAFHPAGSWDGAAIRFQSAFFTPGNNYRIGGRFTAFDSGGPDFFAGGFIPLSQVPQVGASYAGLDSAVFQSATVLGGVAPFIDSRATSAAQLVVDLTQQSGTTLAGYQDEFSNSNRLGTVRYRLIPSGATWVLARSNNLRTDSQVYEQFGHFVADLQGQLSGNPNANLRILARGRERSSSEFFAETIVAEID